MSQVSKKINCLVLQSSPNWVLGKKMINPLNPDDVMNWVILDSSDGLLCVGHQAISWTNADFFSILLTPKEQTWFWMKIP